MSSDTAGRIPPERSPRPAGGPGKGACVFCHLPLRGPIREDDEPAFCCFGCRLADQIAGTGEDEGQVRRTLARLGIAIFFTMNVMVFGMVLWSQEIDAVSPEKAGPMADVLRDLFRYLSLLLSLPVFLLLGLPLLMSAWVQLRRGIIATDGLIALGVAAALLYSAISVFGDGDRTYFEVVCMVLVLVTLGRWMEALGKQRTTEAVSALDRLLPETVRVVSARPDEEIVRPLAELKTRDHVRVLPGERLPCDGRIVSGRAAIDEGMLTGESCPTSRGPGDTVAAGTWNVDGSLRIEATAGPSGGTVARLTELVRSSLAAKGGFERLADRVARVFVPVVLVVAAVTAVHLGSRGYEEGLLGALSVLLIACPCALGLATPMAVWTAVGAATRHQVLFRGGSAIERLARVDTVFFDKTGTLTEADLRVDQVFTATDEAELARRAGALARQSGHVAARAVAQWSGGEGASFGRGLEIDGVRQVPGRGLMASAADGGPCAWLGSPRFLDEAGLAWPARLRERSAAARSAGDPMVAVGWDGQVRGLFVLRERLRETAAPAIDSLRRLGLEVMVLTGDHRGRADRLSRELGVPVAAELEPEDKVAVVAKQVAAGRRVAMVGDGINDAPALARADVGIALGCGADVSRNVADVCLLSNDPSRVAWALGLAKRTVSVIRLNLFWAFLYNVIGIGFAAAGKLNPILAALGRWP